MNFNALIAVLVLKKVITEEEASLLVTHINDKPQSTMLSNAIASIKEVLDEATPAK